MLRSIALRLLRIAAVGGAAGAGLVFALHSRWGPKSRAAIKEFYRPSYNPPPPEWKGATFKPSLDYPTVRPPTEECPWEKIDFKKEPEMYLQTVLEYCFEGNVQNEFVPQKNPKRQWFHAPWMCQNSLGREPIHGLTFELPAGAGYLAETQQRTVQSWAIGFHNEPGAFAFGSLWRRRYKPDLQCVHKFANGSVSFKLLFTEATPDDVPFLKGSPTWKAMIAKNPLPFPSKERTPTYLRLLQVDIAVRDERADSTTGWLFGTFMYHDSVQDDSPWKRLMPVCLMWGNDPSLTPDKYEKGERPKESWVNPRAVATLPKTRPYFGWLGRGNGPADNFKSSCISCHSTANYPSLRMIPEHDAPIDRIMRWLRNIKSGELFEFSGHSFDYSLQMTFGLDSYKHWSQCWAPRFAPIYLSTLKFEFPRKAVSFVSGHNPDPMNQVTPEKK